mgnify:CR=1 FL=1
MEKKVYNIIYRLRKSGGDKNQHSETHDILRISER